MRILVRTFNDSINSKSGRPLPPGQTRGTKDWFKFERLLFDCLKTIPNSEIVTVLESPIVPDPDEPFAHRIYVHKTKRDCPLGSAFYMQMHLKNLFTLDYKGWGADHSIEPMDFMRYSEFEVEKVEQLSDDLLRSGQSKHDQPESTGPTPPKFILVPLQTPRDYTIKWHSPISVKYFVDSVHAWAYETKNHVAFKLHPFNKVDYDLQMAVDEAVELSRYCHKVEGNIHELIKRSDGLFTINSGTGFEALIHGKPVCTFGNCDYNYVTFNADIRRLDEARNFIYSYNRDLQNTAYKFVYWYISEHSIDLNDPKAPEKTMERLKRCLNF